MSIDLSGVKAGDRVRLTATNGDEATFTVTLQGGRVLWSKTNAFDMDDWDALEILPRPLPTKPGIYAISPGLERGKVLCLRPDSAWVALSLHEGSVTCITPRSVLEANLDQLIYLGDGSPENTEDNA